MKRRGLLTRFLGHPAEAAGILALQALFRLLPLETAAGLGAAIARTAGPRLGPHRVALRNLALAFPEMTAEARAALALQAWDNLGRAAGEWAHLFRIAPERIQVTGAEWLQASRNSGRPFILVTAHLANWEIPSLTLSRMGLRFAAVYRRASNPLAERLMLKMRRYPGIEMIPKGRSGSRRILKILAEGRALGLMVDQKLDDGIPVPFFGHLANTAPAPAELALRLGCDLLPLQVERLAGSRFRLTIHPPLPLPDSGNRAADVRELTASINRMLEDWIRQNPGQWLWVHNRWPKPQAPAAS